MVMACGASTNESPCEEPTMRTGAVTCESGADANVWLEPRSTNLSTSPSMELSTNNSMSTPAVANAAE